MKKIVICIFAMASILSISAQNSTTGKAEEGSGVNRKTSVLVIPFESKIKTASTALDRVEKINSAIDKDVEKVLKKAKAIKRKEQIGDIGSVFIHLDISSSMNIAIETAKDYLLTVADLVINNLEKTVAKIQENDDLSEDEANDMITEEEWKDGTI